MTPDELDAAEGEYRKAAMTWFTTAMAKQRVEWAAEGVPADVIDQLAAAAEAAQLEQIAVDAPQAARDRLGLRSH